MVSIKSNRYIPLISEYKQKGELFELLSSERLSKSLYKDYFSGEVFSFDHKLMRIATTKEINMITAKQFKELGFIHPVNDKGKEVKSKLVKELDSLYFIGMEANKVFLIKREIDEVTKHNKQAHLFDLTEKDKKKHIRDFLKKIEVRKFHNELVKNLGMNKPTLMKIVETDGNNNNSITQEREKQT